MNYILIGNFIALIASILMIYSGYVKEKKRILYIQTIQLALFALSNFVLTGFTGAIINIISCIRNILCYKNKLNKMLKVIIIILSTIFTIIFNNFGIIGMFPLIALIVYVIFMDEQNVIKFKCLIIFVMLVWVFYDFLIKSYVSVFFDFFNIVINLISIIQLKNDNHFSL